MPSFSIIMNVFIFGHLNMYWRCQATRTLDAVFSPFPILEAVICKPLDAVAVWEACTYHPHGLETVLKTQQSVWIHRQLDQNPSHVSACTRKMIPARWKFPTGRPEFKAVTDFCYFNSKLQDHGF